MKVETETTYDINIEKNKLNKSNFNRDLQPFFILKLQ